MTAYYNEIEPYAAQWLRNLIAKGLIANGEVDTRSIVDVAPDDLRGFTQCHFFAGIGGWSHALRLAGWPDDRPIWTGSCPCQPFSVAGKGAGTSDPRHLWPHFHRLISSVRPPVVMGEQVAGQAGYGWLDGVRADLERENYASRGVDIPACAVDAPHIRQRLYWVASNMDHANNKRLERYSGNENGGKRWSSKDRPIAPPSSSNMADAPLIKRNGRGCGDDLGARRGVQEQTGAGDSHMADASNQRRERDTGKLGKPQPLYEREEPIVGGSSQETFDSRSGSSSHMADANVSGLRQRGGDHSPAGHGHTAAPEGRSGHWDDHIWLTGSDGKSRRSKPGISLLAHGIPNRVGKLRAYGNAIVPPLAAEVIRAFMETEGGNA